jgi:hypothetical protein
MRSSTVIAVGSLSCLPDEDAGSDPVFVVTTELPAGEPNAFYMARADLAGAPVGPAPAFGDTIEFDVQDGLHKAVIWNGRRIRQKGYSFDWTARR